MPGQVVRDREVREYDYFGGRGEVDDTGDDLRIKKAKDTEEYYNHYLRALQEVYRRATKHWKIYMSSYKDNRKPHEKWRNKVHVPYGYSGVETANATMLDLFFSQSPPFRPEAVGSGLDDVAYRIERWLDYVFRRTRFKREVDLGVREMLVQGLCVRKSALITKERDIVNYPSEDLAKQFEEEIKRVVMEAGMKPPTPEEFEDREAFYEGFEKFRITVNSMGFKVPEMPRPGPQRVTLYKGPGWKRINYHSFLYDPLTEIRGQEVVIQRSIVPLKWVWDRAGEGKQYPFDPRAVRACEGIEGGDVRLNEWQEELAATAGVSSANTLDSPHFKKSVEILEAYHLGDKECPYRMVMNRHMIINKKKEVPWEHGGHPYTILQNVELPFASSSFGDLFQVEDLLKEMNTLRSLRLDGVMLATLPIFAKMREAGLTEMARRIAPGIVFDTARGGQSIAQVSKIEVPSAAFKEIYEIKDDYDTTNATQPMVRGQVGPSNITATHAERAREGAQLRTKQRMFRFEDDMSTTLEHFLSIGHQFYSQEEMDKIGLQYSLTEVYKQSDFIAAITMDYAFRAATTSLNKELDLQQKKDLFVTFVNAQVPRFKPEVMARKLLSDVDQQMEDVWMTEEEYQKQQQELAAQQQAELQAGAGGQSGGGAGGQGAPPQLPQ